MLRRYVSNWYSILAVYAGVAAERTAKFRDGERVRVSKENYDDFYEALFRRHCSDHGLVYRSNGKRVLVEIPGGLRLIVSERGWRMYSFVLDEVFIMKVYGEPKLDRRPVVDVGATIGESALYFAMLGGDVYAFEPNLADFILALENVRLNKLDDRVRMFNQKVSGGTGRGSLESVVLGNSLSNAFLKLDCEGCEYDVIMNTDSVVFERITDIVLECHGHHRAILRRLRNMGFKVKKKRQMIYATRLISRAHVCSPRKAALFDAWCTRIAGTPNAIISFE